jgi:long-chain fatty acid transport protein
MSKNVQSTRPGARWALACALIGLVVCWLGLRASRVKASPPFDLTGDAGGMGGLQPRVVPSSSAAAYFNPALLIDSPAGVQVGFLLVSQQIGVSLDGRPGTEFAVPEGISNAGRSDFSRFDNYPIPTNDLQLGRPEQGLDVGFEARPRQDAGTGDETFTYESFGLAIKLFDDFLALGLYGLIPNGEFTKLRAFYNDEREQYFTNSLHPELYGDRMTAPSIAFGAGVRVTDELALGVGATLNLQAEVVAPTYVVDTGDLEKILIDMDASVNVSLSPHFGASYTIADQLRLIATVHAPKEVELATKFTFLLANGVQQASGVPFLLSYSPWQLALGASFDLLPALEQELSVAATAVYATWSSYVDRHGDRPGKAHPWADTLSPALGVRYRSDMWSALADGAYAPSPVPAQTGRTNYVDSDRVSTALGGELGFVLFGADTHVGLSLQAHRLLPRHQAKLPTPTDSSGDDLAPELVKDEIPDDAQLSGEPLEGAEGLQTNNPGWPGFGSEGWILASALYLRVSL